MIKVTVDLIMRIHHLEIEKGEKEAEVGLEDSVRDEGCLPAICIMLENESDTITKAAKAMLSIATRHPFVEGNKRTAFALAMMILYKEMNAKLIENDTENYAFMKRVASDKTNINEIVEWIKQRLSTR